MPVEAEGWTILALCDKCRTQEEFYGERKVEADWHAARRGWKLGSRRNKKGTRSALCADCAGSSPMEFCEVCADPATLHTQDGSFCGDECAAVARAKREPGGTPTERQEE